MAHRKNARPDESLRPAWRHDGALVPDGARFYRALVENTGDILTLLDQNGTILYQSPAMREVLGYDGEPFVGVPVFDGVHPDDRDRVKTRVQECASAPDWISMETFRLPHRDGSWRWMEARAKNLLHDPDVGAILCVSRDVTEARRLEHQLQQAERLARFGHWRWVKGEPAPSWSEGVAKILERSPLAMPHGGDWYLELIHPEDRDELLSKFLDAFESNEPVTSITRFLASDGTHRYIKTHAYAEADARGEVGALVGLAEDVTEGMHAQEALQRSEAKYRLLAEQASDIIHHIAPDSRMIYLSPSVESLLGYTPEYFSEAKGAGALVHPDDLPRLSAGYREFVLSRDVLRLEYRFLHKAGHYVWLETTMRAVRDDQGKLTEIVGVTRDTSERKKHEIEMMEARERAEAANRTKSRFLANMSHELRTPLNAIIGFSEMLKLEMFGKLGHTRYKEYAQLINESGGLLLDLISDILDMSKIEAGKYELHREAVDVPGAIASALKLMHGRAEEGGLLLTTTICPVSASTRIFADDRALKQILLNLLSNAVKFTPPGGRVVVGAEAVGTHIRFRVTDTGRGIPKEQIPRLARPFEQVSTDAELSKQGTGLGLALVRSLAELHGGSIRIESDVGRGTTVSVELPMSGMPAGAVEAAK
ncbi:MAG TPA: PAS domain-containing protein [Parvibaculum sp.]